ncbi:MAG: hypothetical protein E6J47_04475 [Chloroflexi bacterium]|nr:MAG: hypothetical protein E6J47_04475 [Chloroflexota bacterium]
MRTHRLLVVLTSLALLLSAMAGTVSAKSSGLGTTALQKVQHLGTTRITGSAPKAIEPSSLAGEVRPDPELAADAANPYIKNNTQASRVPSAHVPRPAPQDIVDATSSTTNFAGVNHFVQRTSGTGIYANTQFSLEPPDQGLCVGNNFVLETVNTVVRVRSYAGANLTAAEPINQFFGLAPEIIRSNPLVFGDFTSDPKCYYDAPSQRWFLTVLQLDVDSASGDFGNHAHQYLAVSQTADPTLGWYLFNFDVTDDGTNGTPTHPSCPCYGDQPLIGADANGFYITTNEFPIHNAGFNGANVYAMSKAGLEANSITSLTAFNEPTLAEGQAYSLQPTTTPAGASSASVNNGTEYFLSALEFTGGLDNRIALWALTNTGSLSSTPALSMHVKVLDSEVYGLPAAIQQRSGPAPLRALLKTSLASSVLGVRPASLPISLVQSNDDRMNQAIYLNGHVWGALNTRMKSPTGAIRTGIAWFDVAASWSGSTLGGSVSADGYVAVQNDNVVFPSVAANASGDVLVAFTLLGQDYFPSAAYAWLDPNDGTGDVNVVSWGIGPQDGFTGYITLDPVDHSIARWGDYSAATADESGNIWFATETINQSCGLSTFVNTGFTCGSTRTIFANWGTTIAKVTP